MIYIRPRTVLGVGVGVVDVGGGRHIMVENPPPPDRSLPPLPSLLAADWPSPDIGTRRTNNDKCTPAITDHQSGTTC